MIYSVYLHYGRIKVHQNSVSLQENARFSYQKKQKTNKKKALANNRPQTTEKKISRKIRKKNLATSFGHLH